MELLPFEFVQLAEKSGLSQEKIEGLIGKELAEMRPTKGEDLSWRELPDFDELSANLRLLQEESTSLVFSRIAQRDVIQSYRFFAGPKLRPISLVGSTPNHTIRFEAFSDFKSFSKFVTRAFEDFPALSIDIPSLRNITSSEFLVLTLLVELFVREYPNPDSKWEPDRILRFDAEELLELAQTASKQPDDATWWYHFNRLHNFSPPSLETIEGGIAFLITKELIGLEEESREADRYFLGEDLTWFIRALAWWDRGFQLADESKGTKFILLQATALFVLTLEKDLHFGISNVRVKDVSELLRNYLELTLDAQKEQKQSDSSISDSSPKFCQHCGAKLIPNAKFCMNCGAKVE